MAMGKRAPRANDVDSHTRAAAQCGASVLSSHSRDAVSTRSSSPRAPPFYAPVLGRPSLAPGRYFRLLLLGYFEGLDSERAIAWRAADSLSVRGVLQLELQDPAPDHSTISRTRRLIDLETHTAVFTWVLQRLAEAGLVTGTTVGIDATTLEANAALRNIVRRDTGESYEAFLTQLAEASGIATPTRTDLARWIKDWTHPDDPDARITKMKDGRTHLAHKAEHAVDLDTGAVVGVTCSRPMRATPRWPRPCTAAAQIETVQPAADAVRELVGDKGYHSNQVMLDLEAVGVRAYISEPDRGRRHWRGKTAARDAVYRNRRRIRGTRGQRLLRQRGERVERPFAHLFETGRMRRVHLRGHPNILKRLLVHTAGFNLGLLMRRLTGVGTPRSLQGRVVALLDVLLNLIGRVWKRLSDPWSTIHQIRRSTLDLAARAHDHSSTNRGFHHGLLGAQVDGVVPKPSTIDRLEATPALGLVGVRGFRNRGVGDCEALS